jgi:Immune inhibitor A-like, MAM domain
MFRKALAVLGVLTLLASQGVSAVGAASNDVVDLPIAVEVSDRLKGVPAPEQPTPEEVAAIVAEADPPALCYGDGTTTTITLTSWDPANPGEQDVVFWKETVATSTGKATLWVAWDFLTTAFGRQDVITCDQLAIMQAAMDEVVATDVEYFGQYVPRPVGNPNIDVMIYNIVDEGYFDPEYPFFIAGFFWSGVNEAFDRNMVFIDSYDWANRLGRDALHPYDYEATVAHELEHLIHNDIDGNEDSWVDEGLADMAEFFNFGTHPASHVVYYLAYHRTPLTVWGGGLESYGASYLFQLYLLENFGGQDWASWTRQLVAEPANGIEGIEARTGVGTFNNLYDAWILANYLDQPSLDAGSFPLGYELINLAPFTSRAYSPWSIARSITDIYGSDHKGNLPVSRYWGGYQSGTVEYPVGALPPYAPLYGTFKGMQPLMSINLRGDAQSGVAPYTGTYEAASGGGNMVFDRRLLLTIPVGGTLTFKTWYDIEEEWDYGFIEASTDGGVTWEPLPGSITTNSTNPNNSTAWANSLIAGQTSSDAVITGNSGGWVDASFDLPYAPNVLVRFAYYTDEATNGQGWFVDDVAINGFSDGFESGAGNWSLGGWQRTTGLFMNDWLAAFVSPTYVKGKFSHLAIGYIDLDGYSGKYEYETGVVDTSRLENDKATVVISNRPWDSVFDAGYRELVQKK